jgi:integrase
MGVAGVCRCNELTYLKIENVQDKGKYLFITIVDTKTYVSRSFTVMEEGFSVNALDMCRRYMQLRPASIASQGRFCLRYTDGKCKTQSVGINTMSRIPATVASFLQLPDASSYTGHSMRRFSATLLANAGDDLMAIKRHGGWKSSNVAESYVENSLSNKLKTREMIQKETVKQVAMNR